MKCDGLPDPVCVRELNTYLSLWKEDDTREDIDQVWIIVVIYTYIEGFNSTRQNERLIPYFNFF